MNESTSLFFCPPILSKLHALGMTREEINQRVKDKAFTESESIYGTLYGTLGEEMDEDVSYVVCDCVYVCVWGGGGVSVYIVLCVCRTLCVTVCVRGGGGCEGI